MTYLLRTIDVCLKVIFELILMLILPFMRLWNVCFSFPKNKKICILKRYHDTISHHLASNTEEYIKVALERPPFNCSYVLCVGDEETKLKKLTSHIVLINIYLPPLRWLERYFPHLRVSLRDSLAFIITASFLKKYKIGVIENDYPNNLVFRSIRLVRTLRVKLVTKVIGNADLIYSQTKFPIYFPFKISSRIGNIVHQLYDHIVAYTFFRSCSLVIGCNKDNFDNAIAKGAAPENSYLARIRVDMGITQYPKLARHALKNFPQSGKVILLWSRISPEMMVDVTLKAIAPLLLGSQEVHFVIIGRGPDEEKIKTIAKELSVSKQVHLVGYQSRQYIRSAAEYSDVVISPYGGSALVEAGLLKCAVVGFDYEWQSELLIDGHNGILVDHRSPNEIRAAVEGLLHDSELRKKYGDNLSSLVDTMFNFDKIRLKYINIYGKLL